MPKKVDGQEPAVAFHASSLVTAQGAPTHRAFLVGINGDGLTGCVSGALGMSSVLVEGGYVVSVVLNPTKATLETAFRRFVRATEPGNTVVVYYGGHGAEVNGCGFMQCIDGRSCMR
jgi:hypothetical protein